MKIICTVIARPEQRVPGSEAPLPHRIVYEYSTGTVLPPEHPIIQSIAKMCGNIACQELGATVNVEYEPSPPPDKPLYRTSGHLTYVHDLFENVCEILSDRSDPHDPQLKSFRADFTGPIHNDIRAIATAMCWLFGHEKGRAIDRLIVWLEKELRDNRIILVDPNNPDTFSL